MSHQYGIAHPRNTGDLEAYQAAIAAAQGQRDQQAPAQAAPEIPFGPPANPNTPGFLNVGLPDYFSNLTQFPGAPSQTGAAPTQWQGAYAPNPAQLLSILYGPYGQGGFLQKTLQQGFQLPGQAANALGLTAPSGMTALGQIQQAQGLLPQFGLQSNLPTIDPTQLMAAIPQAQNLASTSLGAGQGFLNMANANPLDMAQSQFSNIMKMLAPQQQQQRDVLNEQLLAQGRLGSTGGGQQQTALENAIQQTNAGAAANALQGAQGYQGMLGNLAQGFLGQGIGAQNQSFGQQRDIAGILQSLAQGGFSQNQAGFRDIANISNANAQQLQNLLGTSLGAGTGFMGQNANIFNQNVATGGNYVNGQQSIANQSSGGGGFLKNLLGAGVAGAMNAGISSLFDAAPAAAPIMLMV